MSRVVEHLAELTRYRDRDLLDVSLVGALKDLLQPECVAVYRSVGDRGDQRWLTRARLAADDRTASADPLWSDLASLPALQAHPTRLACLQQDATLQVPGDPALSLFPLASDRACAGVLEVTSTRPLDAEQTRLVGSILRVYRNFQSLLDYSERDTLTGLLNRKTFDEDFMRSSLVPAPPAPGDTVALPGLRRGAVVGGSTWLGLVDIDHFKRVNDRHGHLIGDEVLLLLARLMRENFRYSDRLYRFGGEEFVVLMRCQRPDDAAAVLERLRRSVAQHDFPRVGRITVSIGFTALRGADTPSSAFERADRAVYHAKENGRDQVADHAALVARGVLVDDTRTGDVQLF